MSVVPLKVLALNTNILPPQISREDETLDFNYPGSDIILRSRDSYTFPLPKLNVIICSPVLRNLIESVSNTFISNVPNGEGREALSLPVVEIPESKETLYHLLTFIFPVTPVLPPTTEKIVELLAVAQKYEMDSVVTHIRGTISLQDPPFLRFDTAIHIYFLAQQYGLHREAVQAARLTMRLPMTFESLGNKLDFPGMTGVYLHKLWLYHKQVRDELKPAILEFKKSGLPDGTKICSAWLYNYINSIPETPHLFDLAEFEIALASHILRHHGSYDDLRLCATTPTQVKRTFCEALTAVFNRVLEKVCQISVTRTFRGS